MTRPSRPTTEHAALAALILAVLVVGVLLLWPRSEKPEPIGA